MDSFGLVMVDRLPFKAKAKQMWPWMLITLIRTFKGQASHCRLKHFIGNS